MMTPASGPNAPDQTQRIAVRLEITESQAASAGILDVWIAARKRQAERQARIARRLEQRNDAARELQQAALRLFQHANAARWSQRKLAAQTGLPKTTLRRLRDQQLDALTWLPKVRAALNRLTTS